VKRFFDDLPGPIDHVLVAAYTSRFYGPMLEQPSEDVGRAVSDLAKDPETAKKALSALGGLFGGTD